MKQGHVRRACKSSRYLNSVMDDVWELYYWTRFKEDGKNHMVGRGEFVRLMFEVTGVKYVEKGAPDTSVVSAFVMGGTLA